MLVMLKIQDRIEGCVCVSDWRDYPMRIVFSSSETGRMRKHSSSAPVETQPRGLLAVNPTSTKDCLTRQVMIDSTRM
jgi:hypothetical protein